MFCSYPVNQQTRDFTTAGWQIKRLSFQHRRASDTIQASENSVVFMSRVSCPFHGTFLKYHPRLSTRNEPEARKRRPRMVSVNTKHQPSLYLATSRVVNL